MPSVGLRMVEVPPRVKAHYEPVNMCHLLRALLQSAIGVALKIERGACN